ncbi:hypothetical protein J7438_12940 [Thalassotalea sp. G20_0]|uniref:hypothetical protein n=1 Tax=Thalassotalea sp. G20_0 TaxID=2821093 RepID=UPI001ADA3792|nr:hypothetical protein [Thalassotalea sp. G20_0]MBO9494984.1 hypothetical protein [Thalassotalea sp. G20_0]
MHNSLITQAPSPAAAINPATTHNPPESTGHTCGHQVSAAEELRKFDERMPFKVRIFSRDLYDREREDGTILERRID